MIAATIPTITFPITLANVTVSAVLIGAPIWLVLRSFLAGVDISDDTIVIRGWIWSRSIPKNRVTSLSRRRFIHWTTGTGKRRLTPLPMFWDHPSATHSMDVHNSAAVDEVRRWLDGTVSSPQGRHHRDV